MSAGNRREKLRDEEIQTRIRLIHLSRPCFLFRWPFLSMVVSVVLLFNCSRQFPRHSQSSVWRIVSWLKPLFLFCFVSKVDPTDHRPCLALSAGASHLIDFTCVNRFHVASRSLARFASYLKTFLCVLLWLACFFFPFFTGRLMTSQRQVVPRLPAAASIPLDHHPISCSFYSFGRVDLHILIDIAHDIRNYREGRDLFLCFDFWKKEWKELIIINSKALWNGPGFLTAALFVSTCW